MFLCVRSLFPRWLTNLRPPQQRAYSLESSVKYKEYFEKSNYLPISFMPAGLKRGGVGAWGRVNSGSGT